MNEFQRAIIAQLILEPRTAQQLAWDMSSNREEVIAAIEDLAVEGLVAHADNVALGDAVCGNSHCHTFYEDAEPGDRCCSGQLIDVCQWRYCGGPISQALAAEAAA